MKTWQLYFIVAATYAAQSVEPSISNIFATGWAALAALYWFSEGKELK